MGRYILRLMKSACLDHYERNTRMFRAALDVLIKHLSNVYNKYVLEGEWPTTLKFTKVLQIHKNEQ